MGCVKFPVLFVQISRVFTTALFLRSQSGTGKTATFSISVLQCLDIQVISQQHVLKVISTKSLVFITKVCSLGVNKYSFTLKSFNYGQ